MLVLRLEFRDSRKNALDPYLHVVSRPLKQKKRESWNMNPKPKKEHRHGINPPTSMLQLFGVYSRVWASKHLFQGPGLRIFVASSGLGLVPACYPLN